MVVLMLLPENAVTALNFNILSGNFRGYGRRYACPRFYNLFYTVKDSFDD